MYPSIPIIAHLPKIHGFLTSPQSKNGSHGSPSSSSTRALAWSEGSSYDLSGGVIFLWLRQWRICWIAWFSEKTHGFLFSIKAIQRKDPLTEFGHFLKVRWDIQFRTTWLFRKNWRHIFHLHTLSWSCTLDNKDVSENHPLKKWTYHIS